MNPNYPFWPNVSRMSFRVSLLLPISVRAPLLLPSSVLSPLLLLLCVLAAPLCGRRSEDRWAPHHLLCQVILREHSGAAGDNLRPSKIRFSHFEGCPKKARCPGLKNCTFISIGMCPKWLWGFRGSKMARLKNKEHIKSITCGCVVFESISAKSM